MTKVKVIVFGSLPIATKVCQYLINNERVELVGVVVGAKEVIARDPWPDTPILYDYCKANNIKMIQFDELTTSFEKKSLDYGITARFQRILKADHINVFRRGVINFHGGLLPEFGGVYSSCHTILEKSPIGGGTVHFIDEGIDTGQIIGRGEFVVDKNDTTFSVFQKTQIELFEIFVNSFDDLIDEKIELTDQETLVNRGYKKRYFNMKSLDNRKELFFTDTSETFDIKVRAFDYPGHEPAYFKVDEKKYYVRTSL